MFQIGQKVVFIGDMSSQLGELWVTHNGIELPVHNQVYTVRRLVQRPGGHEEYGILLAEIVNPKTALHPTDYGVWLDDDHPGLRFDETSFAAIEFRPLITVEKFVGATARAPIPA